MTLLEVARIYYESGLNVLPAIKAQKRPVGAWKKWTKERPNFDEIFRPGLKFDALCVVCGAISGGLEIIDFDQRAAKFDEWSKLVGDVSNFTVETTQSGGKHLAFRSNCCAGNQKLANNASGVTIETRGEGGICLIAPSPGYELVSGDWRDVPLIAPGERVALLNAARSLNEVSLTGTVQKTQKTASTPQNAASSYLTGNETVADYLRGNLHVIRDALTRKGWEYLRTEGDYEYWKRPGQRVADKPGGSLCPSTGNFHCFSSNAAPFEVDGNYTPLQLIATLDYGGDVSAASKAWSRAFPRVSAGRTTVDCFNITENDAPLENASDQRERKPNDARGSANPQPGGPGFPEELFTCGGLLQELFDVTTRYARRAQPEGAFLGALCDMSYLVGRSIMVNVDGLLTTPNVHGLFLAPTGMGKDIIRRVGFEVARAYRPLDAAPESFASVQALQNHIVKTKKAYWLHDEFGRDLKVMSGDRVNANVQGIIRECMMLYSNAGNRSYLPTIAAKEAKSAKNATAVDRPSLTIFATGNPREFFEAASDAILENGYLTRFTIVVGRTYAAKRVASYEEAIAAPVFALPNDLIGRIEKWRDLEDGMSRAPALATYTGEAYAMATEYDAKIEESIRDSIDVGDGARDFKTRLSEKFWKYALLFAASKYGARPDIEIDARCMENAIALSRYELKFFEDNKERFAGNAQTKLCREVLEWATAIGGEFTQSQFTRRFQRKGDARVRREALETLQEGAYINESVATGADGIARRVYRVI